MARLLITRPFRCFRTERPIRWSWKWARLPHKRRRRCYRRQPREPNQELGEQFRARCPCLRPGLPGDEPRVNFFMNQFRKLGFIEYNGGLKIKPALLSVVLHD